MSVDVNMGMEGVLCGDRRRRGMRGEMGGGSVVSRGVGVVKISVQDGRTKEGRGRDGNMYEERGLVGIGQAPEGRDAGVRGWRRG